MSWQKYSGFYMTRKYLVIFIFFTAIIVPSRFYAQKSPSPVINSVVPKNGLANKETLLTIKGENIVRGARVIIGEKQSATVAFFPSKKIVVYSPARALGTVDITLINPDGQSYTMKNGFRYLTKEEQVREEEEEEEEKEQKENSSQEIVPEILDKNKDLEIIKNLLRPYKPYIIKTLVYILILIFLFILLSMNRKNRLIKKIINEKKNISGNQKK